jgi:hypothetical protein
MHCSKVTSLFDHRVGALERCRQNRSSSGLNAKEAGGRTDAAGVIIDASVQPPFRWGVTRYISYEDHIEILGSCRCHDLDGDNRSRCRKVGWLSLCLAERLRSLESAQGLRGTALLRHAAAVRSWSRDSRRIGRRSPAVDPSGNGSSDREAASRGVGAAIDDTAGCRSTTGRFATEQ